MGHSRRLRRSVATTRLWAPLSVKAIFGMTDRFWEAALRRMRHPDRQQWAGHVDAAVDFARDEKQ